MDIYVQLFKNNNFRKFFIALLALDLGRKLSWVALGWFVLETTGSSASIGLVITAATISPLLSSIFVGGILDRYNRKTVMIAENLIRGLVLSTIPILHWAGALNLPTIVTVVFINGILSSFTSIGADSILPSFIKEDELEAGNAVFTMVGQAGSLIGPAIGGLCSAAIGAPMTILLNVFCFLFASFLYSLIPAAIYHNGMVKASDYQLSIRTKIHKYLGDSKEGFAFIFKYRTLIMIALVTFFFNFFYAPLEAMFPVYVDKILHAGPETLGLIWTFFACGSFLGALLWVKLGKNIAYSFALGSVIMLWGLAPVAFGFITNEKLVYFVMFLGGIVYSPYNIVAPTLRQKLIPNSLRGRVFGVYGLIAGLGFPIGVYLGGLTGEFFGILPTILSSGILTISLGFIVFILPILRFKETNTLAVKDSGSI